MCPAGFGSCLVQYFLTMFLSLCFGVILYILCHCMLEICDLFLILIFRGLQLRDYMNLRRNFELLYIVETVIDYGDF